jgi:SAM-dependent methyltransferase
VTFANPFVSRATAVRYHRGRPYHHERTLTWAFEVAPIAPGHALDVACGTGLSTRALAATGFTPVGIDIVPEMIELAAAETGLPFVLGAAEHLPVASRSCSLVTVSSGVHWFEQDQFYREASRVLRPDGLLLLYDHAGVDLSTEPRFHEWVRRVYAPRYPMPPRGDVAGSTSAAPPPFAIVATERRPDVVPLTHDDLVAYFLTHSNLAAVLDQTGDDAAIRAWLRDETSPFFPDDRPRDFTFIVSVQCLRRRG